MRAGVFFCWTSADGALEYAQGTTREVGINGAYVVAERCPGEGNTVQLDIMWPDVGFPNPHGHLTAVGKVLRVDEFRNVDSMERVGFSVALHYFPATDESLFRHWAHLAEQCP